MYKHYLITRFNLRNPNWSTTKNNESLLTDEWMVHRLWLFENFCLPSVMAQTNQSFEWLIYFDTSTSDNFKGQLASIFKNKNNISCFYIDGMQEFHSSITSYIEKDAANVSYIITSRIDNDDCIHKDYINEVQKVFNKQDFMAIDVVKGYSLQISPTMMLGKKEHVYNPFISLIEKKENFKTVWQSDHNMWKKENRITKIKDKRLWMSIIHEKNKVNEFDGYDDVDWNDLSKSFVVSKEIHENISKHIIPHKKWLFLSLKNKMYVNYVMFSKNFKKRLGIYKIKK